MDSTHAGRKMVIGVVAVAVALAGGSTAAAEREVFIAAAMASNSDGAPGFDFGSSLAPGVQFEVSKRYGDSQTIGFHMAVSYGEKKESDYYGQGGSSHEIKFVPLELGGTMRFTKGRFWGGGWAGLQNLSAKGCDGSYDDRAGEYEGCYDWEYLHSMAIAFGGSAGLDLYADSRTRGSLFFSMTVSTSDEMRLGYWLGVAVRTW